MEARKWFKLAAEQGYSPAKEQLDAAELAESERLYEEYQKRREP